MQTSEWVTPIGFEGTRDSIKAIYGGSTYPGIVTPKGSRFILVFSDPEAAKYHGYGLDGWAENGTHFRYTGEGPEGDQELTRGNAAIAEHRTTNRELHLFIADRSIPGTRTRIHRYIGQFEANPEAPWVRQIQPDRRGNPRSTYVFNLQPVGEVERRESESSAKDLPESLTSVEQIDLEEGAVSNFERPAVEAGTAERLEEALVSRFRDHLASLERDVKRFRIYAPGAVRPLFTDICDVTLNVLYEAKASADRQTIRAALGQILDYRRYVQPSAARLLLPNEPESDLHDLLSLYDVGAVWPKGDRFIVRSGASVRFLDES